MTWIETIADEDATGTLRSLYDRVRGPNGQIDHILEAHALRPATLKGHLTLYKNVLHHAESKLPKWFREAIGVRVSHLNGCDYCVAHHFAGMVGLLEDPARAATIREALVSGRFEGVFDEAQARMLSYVSLLTTGPAGITESVIIGLRRAGWDDGEILEANQIAAYFAYANRTVLGLGVHLGDESLGMAPSDGGEEDWSHRG